MEKLEVVGNVGMGMELCMLDGGGTVTLCKSHSNCGSTQTSRTLTRRTNMTSLLPFFVYLYMYNVHVVVAYRLFPLCFPP